jgi:hypothetical protein
VAQAATEAKRATVSKSVICALKAGKSLVRCSIRGQCSLAMQEWLGMTG